MVLALLNKAMILIHPNYSILLLQIIDYWNVVCWIAKTDMASKAIQYRISIYGVFHSIIFEIALKKASICFNGFQLNVVKCCVHCMKRTPNPTYLTVQEYKRCIQSAKKTRKVIDYRTDV